MSGQLRAPTTLPLRKSLQDPLNRLGGLRSESGRGDEKIPTSAGNRIPVPSLQPISLLTEISRLSIIIRFNPFINVLDNSQTKSITATH
jgi:hypothetical protein